MSINDTMHVLLANVQVMTDHMHLILKQTEELHRMIERDISNRADTIENDSRRDGRKVAQ